MSRARPITTPHGEFIIDRKRDGEKAKHEQLEILAAMLAVDMDDLLDEVLTQGEVVRKIRELQGQIPPREVIERREIARLERQLSPRCRNPECGREGDSTQHHFVNKWILRELAYYEQKWAQRRKNCVPVCIDCHRDLHSRDNGSHPIAEWLSEEEREFAEDALTALSKERPALVILIARGDESTYETRLVRDWMEGRFRAEEPEPAATVAYLRVAV
jgi:5-methylcytosine-specific restriction endonuclease McrA